ncbi:uncharacterized protein LOC133741880 [Rosa rugosa]|uniref:uncharacterized protein LOC133741880 n=1 Tax=Rosa rugosa TaxID=74645 RepID=UPI002B417F14|nr:uncharacterized protein LOC133741880 [Rosa rugosa]
MLPFRLQDLFPHSHHRHCVRHLHNNFKSDGHTGLELKQRLWAIARASTMTQYTKAMNDLAKVSFTAWQWCNDRPAVHWSRSHFDEILKCDVLLNNHSESFNKSILDARKKPIIPCLEEIRVACMVRLGNRRNSAPRWRSKVGPRIEKLLKKNAEWATEYRPVESSEWRFELHGRGVGCQTGVIAQHSVQLDLQSCTCRRWDLSGIPCGHAIAAIYSKGWSPEDFVSEWYTEKKFMEAYEVMLQPIAGAAEWEVIERPITPPLHQRQPGRPRTKRTKEPGEEPPAPGIEKLPRSHYTQVECGICGKKGHNKRTCVRRNEGANERVEPPVAEANVEMMCLINSSLQLRIKCRPRD